MHFYQTQWRRIMDMQSQSLPPGHGHGQENYRGHSHSQHAFMNGMRRGRPQPTQIPMHCLQLHDAWNQRRDQQQFQQEQNGNGQIPQSPQTFAEVASNYPPLHQQQQQQGNPQQLHPQYYQATTLPLKLIQAARQGYSQFQRDFRAGDQPFNPNPGPGPMYHLEPRPKPPREFHQDQIKFDVDEREFEDQRPIKNFIEPGQREFKLFDDYNKSGADQIKNVYNVNTMDYCNAREICGKRLYQQSISRWPVDAIAADLCELKKQTITIPGRVAQTTFMNILDVGIEFENTNFNSKGSGSSESGTSSSSSSSSSPGPAGAFGLMSLARCLNGEGGEKNKMGYVTFVGMNLHKLFKDIDRSEPVCPTFAGPLADRNYQLESGEIGIERGYPEYELMEWNDADWRENYRMKSQLKIKRRLLDSFPFETLVFMFYTFHGDALQLLAAQQLYKRGWRFHKLYQVWVCPDRGDQQNNEGMDASQTIGWVPGNYRYFDYSKWEFVLVNLKHVDGVLEGKPPDFEDALWEV